MQILPVCDGWDVAGACADVIHFDHEPTQEEIDSVVANYNLAIEQGEVAWE